ncbi:hypothetical protein GGS24DRAFT_513559 [Hypoxylon argillaceum]|nr:hypothetical protein GGS24DRAFT_513559 [Hypoxylon argillaceum]
MPYDYEKVENEEFRLVKLNIVQNIELERELQVELEPEFEQMLVRPNLLWALKHILQWYRGFRPLLLWVDFICINQNDLTERSQQLQWMTEIYKKAEKVHVWLGKPGYLVDVAAQDDITSKELETAVQSINHLGNLDDANHLGSVDIGIRSKASKYDLEPLFKLLKLGVATNDVLIHCGDQQFKWEQLTHAVALLEKFGRDGSIDRLFKLRPQTGHVFEYIGNISALPAYRLIQNVSGLYRELGNKARSETRTIEQLVCYLVVFDCTEPRDVIYALLGIASDVQPVQAPTDDQPAETTSRDQSSNNKRTGFPVNYKEDILKVYKRFLKHAIKESGSLDILCRPWAPVKVTSKTASKAIELPSWILDATRKPFRATARGKMIRYNPDPFVGPAISRGFYAASGGCKQSIKGEDDFFKIEEDSNTNIIRVEGFKLGTPSEIWDLALHGNIPASWLKGANWDDASKPPPDEFWRTLVADRTSAGTEPEPGYPWIIQRAVLEKGVQYGISTREFLYEADNTTYHEVFRRVEAVVWNRKLIRATLTRDSEMQPLGLVPAETRESDWIYIVRGCSVPLVLRERVERKRVKWNWKQVKWNWKRVKRRRAKREKEKAKLEKAKREEAKREAKREKMKQEKLKQKKVKRRKVKREKAEREQAEREKVEREKVEWEKARRERLKREKVKLERTVYELIGECYINNMMDGKAVDGRLSWMPIEIE